MEVTSQRLQARGEKLEAVSHRLLTSSFKLEVGDGEGDGKRGERDRRERKRGREGGRERLISKSRVGAWKINEKGVRGLSRGVPLEIANLG